MLVLDFFNQEGTKVPISGNKPQLLDDADYVWIVGQGRVSVFLTILKSESEIGVKNFLFDVEQGDLLFGITPAGSPEEKCFLASGLSGSTLIRLEVGQLRQLVGGET